MEKAIEKLTEQVQTCIRMESWYENELQRKNHITADQTEVFSLKQSQSTNIAVKESCIKAIDILKSHN